MTMAYLTHNLYLFNKIKICTSEYQQNNVWDMKEKGSYAGKKRSSEGRWETGTIMGREWTKHDTVHTWKHHNQNDYLHTKINKNKK